MYKLNENIITLYSKWKEGYTRKENSFELKVKDFLSNRRIDAHIFYISEDGNHLNAYNDVYIYDNEIHDGKLPVPFGKADGDFNCKYIDSLTSLEGAPEKVKGKFDCSCCDSLLSLKGAPKEVEGNFSVWNCTSLTSLEGAPEKVKGDFVCYVCPSLTSLKGLPKEIGGSLYIDVRFKKKIPKNSIISGNIRVWEK